MAHATGQPGHFAVDRVLVETTTLFDMYIGRKRNVDGGVLARAVL
jgi:hypothetical protein